MAIYKEEFELNFALHHFVSIVAFYCCTNAGVFPFIALFRLTSEGSTPFLNLRWILLSTNRKETKLYVINGLLLFISFFLVRILTIIPNWYLFFDSMSSPGWNSIPLKYKIICVGSCVPLDVLNVFWYSKIARGVYKFFAKSNLDHDHDRDYKHIANERKRSLVSNITEYKNGKSI